LAGKRMVGKIHVAHVSEVRWGSAGSEGQKKQRVKGSAV